MPSAIQEECQHGVSREDVEGHGVRVQSASREAQSALSPWFSVVLPASSVLKNLADVPPPRPPRREDRSNRTPGQFKRLSCYRTESTWRRMRGLARRIELAALAPTARSEICPFRFEAGHILSLQCQMIARGAAPARIAPLSRATTEVYSNLEVSLPPNRCATLPLKQRIRSILTGMIKTPVPGHGTTAVVGYSEFPSSDGPAPT